VHRNENVPNFGAYGDIMIRDRKMYVVRTLYAIADGLATRRTLILPSGWDPPHGLKAVGRLERLEADEVAIGYAFDLRASRLQVMSERNPNAGKAHTFTAYRARGRGRRTHRPGHATGPEAAETLSGGCHRRGSAAAGQRSARRGRADHRRRPADARTAPRPGLRAAGHRRRTAPTLRAAVASPPPVSC
jgi:hypothetical protein